jgi:hypothetical protein
MIKGYSRKRKPPKLDPGPRKKRLCRRQKEKTPQQLLGEINIEIASVEAEIEKKRDLFESLRVQLMTGIVMHTLEDGAKQAESMIQSLTQLKKKRELALSRADTAAFDLAFASHSPVKVLKRPIGLCVGGCNVVVDDVTCVDVCLICHATYDRRVDNLCANIAYGDLHPGETTMRIGGYRPPNHFAEILSQFQGKRRASAPQDVVDKISSYCSRYNIQKNKITPRIVRMFLKQMQQELNDPKSKKYTDYYKQCPEIAHRLSGIPPPYMTPMQENRVAALFPLVVRAYKTSPRYIGRFHNHNNRKSRTEPNNMNYYYVLYKLCQLLGYNEFLPYISLPKSIANVDDNDESGWKHICGVNGWSYTSTR